MPIANVPHIHYVIEFLLMNEVKEIIIATCKNSRTLVDQFVKKQNYKGARIKVVAITTGALSFGDALREVAEMSLIKDDFIVVRGDIITNIVLEDAFKMHYHIKQEEGKKENLNTEGRKNKTIMTKLMMKRPNSSPLKHPS